MSRTVTAMFDSRADAEAARERLLAANLDADNVKIHDQSSVGDASRGYSSHREPGMWASLKNAFLPDEDRYAYEEGMRRGAFLLTADVDENEADEAVRALEDANTVDIEGRAGQWRSQGWNPSNTAKSGAADRRATGQAGDEEHIDLVEEQLVVGKREVERGGVRIRSYVTEKPVHEQIRLRDETISVERRPVDRAVAAGDDAFRDRTIEMTETDEEAVVGKKARVVEEVALRKTAEDRVEDINETVRRTEIDVDNLSESDQGKTGGRISGGTRDAASEAGDKAAGLGNETMGNLKQGLGSLTGNEKLERSGEMQERKGEGQQRKGSDRSY